MINKIRALGSWYTKGLENGSHLRTAINRAESIEALREVIRDVLLVPASQVMDSIGRHLQVCVPESSKLK